MGRQGAEEEKAEEQCAGLLSLLKDTGFHLA